MGWDGRDWCGLTSGRRGFLTFGLASRTYDVKLGMLVKTGRPLNPATRAALDKIWPEIQEMTRSGAAKSSMVNMMVNAGVPRRTAYRILGPANPQGERTDLIKALKWRSHEPQGTLIALKQKVAEHAKVGASRAKLTKILQQTGDLSLRSAQKFLEPFYQHPDPMVRLEKELDRLIRRNQTKAMKAKVQSVGREVERRLKAGWRMEDALNHAVQELGVYGITAYSTPNWTAIPRQTGH